VSAERVMQWLDPEGEGGLSLRQAMLLSLAAHLVLVALLSLTPTAEPIFMPPSISIDLLAALPSPASEAPKPVPVPVPVAKPKPKPKVKILPKQAPSATAKPRARPKPEPIKRRERPKEMSYDDALAKLRKEIGEPAPVVAAPQQVAKAPTTGAPVARGVKISPEVAAWMLRTKKHIRSNLITPLEFRESGLVAELVVELAADGRVMGEPELVRSSGNPYYDDNAKRAILKSSPLPAPPKAGRRTIIFTPEE